MQLVQTTVSKSAQNELPNVYCYILIFLVINELFYKWLTEGIIWLLIHSIDKVKFSLIIG